MTFAFAGVELGQVETPRRGPLAPREVEMLAVTSLLRLHAIAMATGVPLENMRAAELAEDVRRVFGALERARSDGPSGGPSAA